ncbi:Glu/Leu/Phe/Val dehydrogenase family protein [Labedella endophytica]|uniref:Glu/Leu/Phe/Val dehydrogenase n=1 Tax=Labedella endophytica TaxID=1523160 RepID=A0A433JU09_9MICO|nr:Glu/Leu/Phe/Val dehydrogenase dimerization domain-containing protein [Labedella endophytica]RUR01607.1 Glu/Leu/Phe/Val dehydrogenase [Labedella endophytica]
MTLTAPTTDDRAGEQPRDHRTAEHTTPLGFEHERVVVATGSRSRLTIIVAVHSTRLGAALGGARLWTYPTWTDALDDALRLSEGMTLKNACAGLEHGGGKAVIHIPLGMTLDAETRRNALLDLGDVVESVGGRYVTAEDVGTSSADMAVVRERTTHVTGLPLESGGVGEPSEATAAGVVTSIRATMECRFGSSDLGERRATISGLGHVGSLVARTLRSEGVDLTVTDVNPARRALAEELGAMWVSPGSEHLVETDVFVPCGVGGALTETVVAELACVAVVGAANNQLASRSVADLLAARGILWAPDFIVNAGGVIHLAFAAGADGRAVIAERVAAIGDTVRAVFDTASSEGTTTLAAAERLAARRLGAVEAPTAG